MQARRVRALSVTLILCASVAAAAGDWCRWGGDGGCNHVSSETKLPASFDARRRNGPDGKPAPRQNLKWLARLGKFAYGNPTVSQGRVFVGTDDSTLGGDPRFKPTRAGLVQCFDEKTGKLLWRLVVPKRGKIPKKAHYGHQHLGVCSSPTVDGNRAYVMTCATEIVCLDTQGQADGNAGPFTDEAAYMAGSAKKKPLKLTPADADIVWSYDLIDVLGVVPHDVPSCSVLIVGRFLYTATSNGVDGPHKKMVSPDAPSFIALDKTTGKLAATDDLKLGHRIWHCLWSPPSSGTVGGRTLVFFGGGDGICYAFDALTKPTDKPVKLATVWSYDCNPPRYRLRNGKTIDYYAGDKRKKSSPNRNDGAYLGPSQIIGSPAFHQGRVYVIIGQDPLHGRGKGLLHCIDASKTGDISQSGCVWQYDGLDRSMATPTIADGLVYAADVAGRLHCLDAATGKPLWVHEAKAETWGSPLVADGKVFLGTSKRFLVFAHGREKKLLGEVNLGSPMHGTAIAANGTLFVASNRYLYAVAQGAVTK